MSFYSEIKAWAGNKFKIYPLVAPVEAKSPFAVYTRTNASFTYSNFGVAREEYQYTLVFASDKYSQSYELAEAYYNEYKKHPNVRFDDWTERYDEGFYIQEFTINYKV
jgi:hypothetical protein